MDTAYIIDNGILEQYVLGELTYSEEQQVKGAIIQNPELKERLESIEMSFETLAFENELDVPRDVKTALLNQVGGKALKIASLKVEKSKSTNYAIAASVIGFLLVSSIYVFSKWQSTEEQLEIVETENARMLQTINKLNSSLADNKKWYSDINDPNTVKYVLKGNSSIPNATMISYVNDVEKSVIVTTENLPKLDNQHDYQMWADVKGVMVNMGVIDKSVDMMAMTYIENAESLNLTIEEAGGSDHPNVSQLVTNIYLK